MAPIAAPRGSRHTVVQIDSQPQFDSATWRLALRDLRADLAASEPHRMQLVVALAGAMVALGLGVIYGNNGAVAGWQLWLWLLTLAVVIASLTPALSTSALRSPDSRWLLGLFIVALVLRAAALDTIPPGLHPDEMGTADFTARHVLPGGGLETSNPFRTGPNAHPTFYYYIVRLCFALFGYNVPALKLSSAVAGSLAVVATYAVVAVFHNRRTALLAAAIMTTYHFHIHWSRIALNNIWDTLWIPLYLAVYAWGWRRDWSGGAVLSGLAFGLSHYFYPGNKIGVLLLLYVVLAEYRREPNRRRFLVHTGKLTLTAFVVVIPLAIFAWYAPDIFFSRVRDVVGWHRDAVVGAMGSYDLWGYAKRQIVQNVGAFVAVPDTSGFYGSGVPLLIGLAAPLFLVGLLWEAGRRAWLPVLWILTTLVIGGILMKGAPSGSYFVGAIPAMCWLVASPIDWLWSRGRARLALFLVVAIMATDAFFYFTVYAASHPRDLVHPMPPWPR